MGFMIVFLMVVYAVIGGLTTLYLFFSFPAVIVWKFYRKLKYGISVFN
jgi:phosphate starvation-inducible membrane PsiE